MQSRLGSALSQALIMMVVMFLFRRLFALLPFGWPDETWRGALAFAVLFGLTLGLYEWFRWPRRQREQAGAAESR